jgi:hypothetical protein
MEALGASDGASLRFAGGVKVAGQPLWFDARERKPVAVLSSALSAPLIVHERTVLHTRVLDIHPRKNTRQVFLSAAYGEPVLLGDWDITLLPSGFNPGAAQIRLVSKERRFLYAGPFNTRPTKVTEDFEGARADILGLDLDWVRGAHHSTKRETIVARVLQRVQETLDEGRMPVLFVPPFGIPQELALALGDDAPPLLVHDAVMGGLRALRRGGFTLSRQLHALKRSQVPPGHVLMVPEHLRGHFPLRENRRVFVFDADLDTEVFETSPGACDTWRFPRFNEPDLTDLNALVDETAPSELVYLATKVDAWRGRVPEPTGVAVRFVEKEAQMGLL